MIEINLLPGAGKKPRGRSTGFDFASVFKGVGSQIRDPWLIGAIASVVVAAGAVLAMYFYQHRTELALDDRLQKAEQDSIRYVAVIREKRKAEARRDSVIRQVDLIKAIDSKRFIWPHLMDEVSRALPPYTWLTSVAQTNVTAAAPVATSDPAGKKKVPTDSVEPPKVNFRIIGNTVDIQALTRFMKLLEASPFIENVQIVKSSMILVDGKEVTEFQLDAQYQVPDPSSIRSVPVSLSVR
ncbi:MAG: PilN domain-containing protein [Gemmatimonadota bacterium]|nr:PilN domain-containing protein [Gemmatimonadota bacterium]